MTQAFYLLFSLFTFLLFCYSVTSIDLCVCISRVFYDVVISSMVSMDRSFVIVRGYVMQVITECM